MSTYHIYKSGVEDSNGDVASGLPRPLAPETTSGRNLENHKTLKNSETAADRRFKHKDTKVPYSVRLSKNDTISGERRHLLPISASGLFCQNEKVLITRKRWEFDAPVLQDTNSKPRSTFRMVKLLPFAAPPSGGFRFRSSLPTTKIANKSRTVAAGRKMSMDHQ
jgi:hypothetical protein